MPGRGLLHCPTDACWNKACRGRRAPACEGGSGRQREESGWRVGTARYGGERGEVGGNEQGRTDLAVAAIGGEEPERICWRYT
eukprot:6212022-Pleurochrysis_carterae.AAC.5